MSQKRTCSSLFSKTEQPNCTSLAIECLHVSSGCETKDADGRKCDTRGGENPLMIMTVHDLRKGAVMMRDDNDENDKRSWMVMRHVDTSFCAAVYWFDDGRWQCSVCSIPSLEPTHGHDVSMVIMLGMNNSPLFPEFIKSLGIAE